MAILVLTGVTGCGKTTVGKHVAHALDPVNLSATFLDADWFHPERNVAKMTAGIALQDKDRWPWIQAVGSAIARVQGDVVVAFSGLKKSYRDELEAAVGPFKLFYLELDEATAFARVSQRPAHYMPRSLVHSQFEILEPPASGITIDARLPVAEIVARILPGTLLKGD